MEAWDMVAMEGTAWGMAVMGVMVWAMEWVVTGWDMVDTTLPIMALTTDHMDIWDPCSILSFHITNWSTRMVTAHTWVLISETCLSVRCLPHSMLHTTFCIGIRETRRNNTYLHLMLISAGVYTPICLLLVFFLLLLPHTTQSMAIIRGKPQWAGSPTHQKKRQSPVRKWQMKPNHPEISWTYSFHICNYCVSSFLKR